MFKHSSTSTHIFNNDVINFIGTYNLLFTNEFKLLVTINYFSDRLVPQKNY